MSNPSRHSHRIAIVVVIIGGTCTIIAACIGLGAPIIEWVLNTFGEEPTSVIVEVQTTPTLAPFPSDAVQLPAAQSTVLSVVIRPGPLWRWVGLITADVDRSALTQTISSSAIFFPGDFSPRFTRVSQISTVWVNLTGKSEEEPVQVSNRVPIKLVSYQPIPDDVDVVGMEIGGGGDVWLLGANLSEQVMSYPDRIVWATYTSDLRSRLIEAQQDAPEFFDDLPSEVQKAILSDMKPLPDYFLLENNERIVLSIATIFQQPGIYHLQFGAEYLYKEYHAIVWAEPSIEVYVLNNYYIWLQSGSETYYPWTYCRLQPTGEYQCVEK